jgi:hypothetical protein
VGGVVRGVDRRGDVPRLQRRLRARAPGAPGGSGRVASPSPQRAAGRGDRGGAGALSAVGEPVGRVGRGLGHLPWGGSSRPRRVVVALGRLDPVDPRRQQHGLPRAGALHQCLGTLAGPPGTAARGVAAMPRARSPVADPHAAAHGGCRSAGDRDTVGGPGGKPRQPRLCPSDRHGRRPGDRRHRQRRAGRLATRGYCLAGCG